MPSNTTVLIIRHAEEPENDSPGLSPAGQARAQAYSAYFRNYVLDSQPIKPDYLFAAADKAGSYRPRLTLEPLAQALGLTINSDYQENDVQRLADTILRQPEYDNGRILICWRYEEIPNLAKALGVNPAGLPLQSNWPVRWPEFIFGWTLQISYDGAGNLIPAHTVCCNQRLMYTDCGRQPPVGSE